jgi:leucyl-tRNA synthetase
MIAVNDLNNLKSTKSYSALKPLITLLSPFAPHLAEELWKFVGGEGLVVEAVWPKAEKTYLVEDEVTYPMSFNGKVRFKLTLPASTDKVEVEAIARADERTIKQLDGKEIRKVIVVPGRIVNIVS